MTISKIAPRHHIGCGAFRVWGHALQPNLSRASRISGSRAGEYWRGHMPKPTGYPLPWCEAVDAPYCDINLSLCTRYPEWRAEQSGKPMSAIIPKIDALIASSTSTQ